jgi:mono/diheme cytochrome c family protein
MSGDRRESAAESREVGVRARLRVAFLLVPLALTACDWFTDFKRQPSVKPWGQFSADSGELKGFRGQPANSVSTTGSVAPGYAVSYAPLPATIDSFAAIPNPVAPDARSLLNGRKYYQITCAPCHGDAGDANSPMKQLSPMYAFVLSLVADQAKGRSDGYIWGMMRNGRGLMPSANRIEDMDRWDVVNYVRGLQGRYAVERGPVGRPGETGDKLPGASLIAPTVPAKYFHPTVVARPAKAEPGRPDEARKTEPKP